MGVDWTKERIERLEALNAEGLSHIQIARVMGLSYGAVQGKLARLGKAMLRDLKKAQVRSETPDLLAERKKRSGKEKPKLADLGSNDCRWPMGDDPSSPDFHFCGKPKKPGKGSYCEEHSELNVKPWKLAKIGSL